MRRAREQHGLTLVELLLEISILSVAVLTVGSLLPSVSRAAMGEVPGGRLERARTALVDLEREIRLGSGAFDLGPVGSCPECEPGYALGIYHAYDPAAQAATCTEWLVDGAGRLVTRSRAVGAPSATPWRVVVSGVVNRAMGRPVFSFGDTGGVDVTLLVRPDRGAESGHAFPVSASVALPGAGSASACGAR